MTAPQSRPEARAAQIRREADIWQCLADSVAAAQGMTDQQARAYLARERFCPRHACSLPCNTCEAEADRIDPGRDDGMSEGDMRVLDRRAEDATTREWMG